MPHGLVIAHNGSLFDEYSYYKDWLNGLCQHPDFQIDLIDIQNRQFIRGAIPIALRHRYDLIIFLHSTYQTLTGSPLRFQMLRGMLKTIKGPRVFFLNNEFRDLDVKCQMADSLGARFLVSQLNYDDASLLYQDIWQHEIISMPYGFDPAFFKPLKSATERSIDIGFRGDYYPAYIGHDDRDLLLDNLRDILQHNYPQVKADIQVGERFEREGWVAFLNNCRSLVGHEAGMTRLDKDENIRRFINAQNKRLTPDNFRKLILAMRDTGVFEGPPSGRIAAPRNFEALGTRTLQILLPGRYNDVLQPGIHYLELQRDFSNLDKVIDTLFDESAYNAIVERAYADGMAYHTYEHRIKTLFEKVHRY